MTLNEVKLDVCLHIEYKSVDTNGEWIQIKGGTDGTTNIGKYSYSDNEYEYFTADNSSTMYRIQARSVLTFNGQTTVR